MASAYPGGLDNFPTTRADGTATPTNHPTDHNDANDAINKIEAELGVTPSGALATVAARLAISGARVEKDASQAVVDDTEATITWQTEIFDTDGYWSVGEPTRLTIPTGGLYLIVGGFEVDGSGTDRCIITIKDDGGGVLGGANYGNSNDFPVGNVSVIALLNAAQWVTLRINIGGSRNVIVGGGTFFSIARLAI